VILTYEQNVLLTKQCISFNYPMNVLVSSVIQAYKMYVIIVDIRSVYGIEEMDLRLHNMSVASTHHDITDKLLC
jgi:hypothetical protein